ncbi:uncharacterized protein [Physcomitrium patens]|uniref:Uncharacterized protein n=1 Tax=Physcomitrium patens TaxID=3218 RepID=A0A2K1KGV6_PHYPA|nr:uncharacterized protein LOC112283910 [Physcomitrium patens]PNR53007.1 hypothetical protein PHYPA_009382 [Physcomitrium patens]|eukprot:XP_024379061.1 uncharacterized protein LOC112283910 [Physcomitrella patens]
MTLTSTLGTVRNTIPSISRDTISGREASTYGRTLNLLDPWSKSFGQITVVAHRAVRLPKYAESSSCTQETYLSWGKRITTRAAFGFPASTTSRNKLFNSTQKGEREKNRRSSIVKCEETPGHDEHCEEWKRYKKANTSSCEGQDHGEVREWKTMRDASSEHTRRRGEERESNEETEWKGDKVDCEHPEYTPNWRGERVDEGRASSSLRVGDKGYVIKVSKELMGLFCYIEKRKRILIKELAHTLKQVAAVAFVLTCVRGVFSPLVEVFRTSPPTWSKLLLMLVSFDSVAICYLAIKSAEPLDQLGALATENRPDIMEGIEKEEEMVIKFATEFIRLFKRLRNIAISITVSQLAQLVFTVLRLKDPQFVHNCLRIVQTWMQTPWA